MVKKVLFSLFISFMILFLISCKKGDTDISREHKKVVLKIHAWEGYAREHESFFKKYLSENYQIDAKLEISSTTGYDSFVEAIKNNGAHLISPANDLVSQLQRNGLIRPLDSERIKNFNQINPIIMKTRCTEIGGVLYAVPFNFGAYLLAYNKDKMPAPDSYKVLWDSKYHKRVTIPDVYDSINVYMTALMLGIPRERIFNLSDSDLLLVEQKLKLLNREQVSDFWSENLNPEKREMFDVGMDWGIGVLKINENYGGNWGVVIPKEGATAWVDTWAMTVNIRDDLTEKAAYAYIEFMISPETQARMAKTTSYGPVNPYSTRYLSAEEKKKFYLTDPKFMKEFILWQPLTESNLKRYKETWQRSRQN